jgi:hypothetical protein
LKPEVASFWNSKFCPICSTSDKCPTSDADNLARRDASTLDLAVASVLEQSIGCLELVGIGDGVRDDTREVIGGLDDRRIRFVDEPKTRSRAELDRHRVLSEADSDSVCYLGDDDVMVSDHIEEMVEALHHVDVAHPLPLYVSPDGSLRAHPTDLSLAECRDGHLHPARNAVSPTGWMRTVACLPGGGKRHRGAGPTTTCGSSGFELPDSDSTPSSVSRSGNSSRRSGPGGHRHSVGMKSWRGWSEAPRTISPFGSRARPGLLPPDA